MEQKKVGVIGFGVMGRHLSREFHLATGGLIKVVGVVEPSDRKYGESYEFIGYEPPRCGSVGELLKRDLDGLAIASPNGCHLENLREVEGRALPLLLEKPLESTFEKICDVLRFAEGYGAPIVVDHVMRYAPIVAKAKALLEAGAIGKICSVSFVQNCFYGNNMYRNFRRTLAGGGGMFIEKATHDFDVMLHLLETRPAKVSAIAQRQAYGGSKPDDLRCGDCDERLACPESVGNVHHRFGRTDVMEVKDIDDLCVYADAVDVPDNEVCMIAFENGTFGTYAQCFFSPPGYSTREYEIVGLEGIMRISFSLVADHNKGRLLLCPRFGTPHDASVHEFEYRGRIHYNGGGAVARHFHEIMDGTAAPFTTVRHAFAAEVLGYAATLAGQRGRSVLPGEIVPDDLKPIWNEVLG